MNGSREGCRKSGHLLATSVSFVALSLLSGCASLTPGWDSRFGDSVRLTTAQQTLNPEASRNVDPVSGMDGRSANEAVKRYYKSFQEPPPPPPLFQMTVDGGD